MDFTSHPIGQALTLGFHLGFLGAVAFVVLAIIAAASSWSRSQKQELRKQWR